MWICTDVKMSKKIISRVCLVCLILKQQNEYDFQKKVCKQCYTIEERPCTCCRIIKDVSAFTNGRFECKQCISSKKVTTVTLSVNYR